VKIKVIHTECGREILVRQVLETGGHCPWDGKAISKDYTAVLAEALETSENAGGVLENALEKIAGMNPAMTIDRESLLGGIEEPIDQLNRSREPARR
jgi:hypothetical protein